MAEEFEIEILVIISLLVLSFVAAHLLRKFYIIWLPESIVAVTLSMLMAVIWYKMPGLSSGLSFNNETFFLVLLPFIIFESGFSVHRQSLFRNMGSILMYAILGTFLSAFGIGGFLFGALKAKGSGYDFSFLDCMIIGAILSSTDPVATLSIFSKLEIDRMTYSLVFGESMLNDAVSIVSFKTLGTFYSHAFSAATFFRAVGMFLLIFVGAFIIGILMAAFVSFILRRTDIGRSHQPMEVIFVVGGAYLSYFVSDFAQLSGIVSIFFYGIASRHYTYYTLSDESQKGSHWIFEAVKEVAEMLVFVLLGVTILEDALKYDWFLISMTCLGCLLARAVATVTLTFILNLTRPESDRISYKSQLVIWNAGLRGAVAYALAVSSSMPKLDAGKANLMITTVHASVIFTILFHGMLTVPIVKLTGLAGVSRQLSEPRAARKKIHGFWSRIDKNYIIPFISFARRSPSSDDERSAPANGSFGAAGRGADAGTELDERESSMDDAELDLDIEAKGRLSYDGFDQNPNNLDTSLFEEVARGRRSKMEEEQEQEDGKEYDDDFQPRASKSDANEEHAQPSNVKWDLHTTGHGALLRKSGANAELASGTSTPTKSSASSEAKLDSSM